MNEQNNGGTGGTPIGLSAQVEQALVATNNGSGVYSLPMYGGNNYTFSVIGTDQSGIGISLQSQGIVTPGKRISPRLYFNYVKSKLSKLETKKLKSKLQKLQALLRNSEEVGQTALSEEYQKMLLVAVRDSEAASCGYDTYILGEHINKFRYLVKENDKANVNPVEFKKLSEFPRSIPANIQKTIKAVQKKGLFDELHVLYLDYTKEPIKSNKEKIREKDPVLFGTFAYDPSKYYYIADWVDEYCDLTLGKFIDTLKTNDKEYDVNVIEDISTDYLARIKAEIKELEERLSSTRPNNFRDKMKEEELAKERAKWREEAAKELKELAAQKDAELAEERKNFGSRPWYKRLF